MIDEKSDYKGIRLSRDFVTKTTGNEQPWLAAEFELPSSLGMSAVDLVKAGEGLKDLGLLEAAIESFHNAIAADPGNAVARSQLDDVMAQLSGLSDPRGIAKVHTAGEAKSYAEEAIQRHEFPLAAKLLLLAAQLEPNNPYMLTSVGALFRRCEHLDEARTTLEHALDLGAGAPASTSLAAVERDTGNYDVAISLYEQLLKDDQDNGFVLNGLGGVYHDLRRYTQAEEYFGRAAQIPGSHNETSITGLQKLLAQYLRDGDEQGVNRVRHWLSSLDGPATTPGMDSSGYLDDIPF